MPRKLWTIVAEFRNLCDPRAVPLTENSRYQSMTISHFDLLIFLILQTR